MKILKTIAGILCVSLLTGCSYMFDQNDWDLPSDPVSYQVQTSEEYGMDSITVEGREYLPFGQYSQKEKGIMVSSCIGYIGDNTDNRIYTLENDALCNYLLIRNVEDHMDHIRYWRAADTIDQNIDTPHYIEPAGNEIWNNSGIFGDRACVYVNVVCNADDVAGLKITYVINGESGSMTSGGDHVSFGRGSNHAFHIGITDKECDAFKGSQFGLDLIFYVIDTNGEEHVIHGDFSGNVRLEDNVDFVLSGSAGKGYSMN